MDKIKFSVWEFDRAEQEQIIGLVEMWAKGMSNTTIDRRKTSKQVQEYITNRGLAQWVCKLHGHRGERIWGTCQHCQSKSTNGYWRLQYADNSYFNPLYDLPVEILWEMVQKHILQGATNIGFSIAKSRGWFALNIGPEGTHWTNDREYKAKVDILAMLASRGYIHFATAGDIWQVVVRER